MKINNHLLILFSVVTLFVVINGDRLSKEENSELQETCGKKLDNQSKITSEEPNYYGNFPWAVSVHVRFMNRTLFSFDVVHVPGTIISPRHILTYSTIQVGSDGNLILLGTNRTKFSPSCEGDHLVIPKEMNSRYDFGFEHFQKFDNHREFQPTISKITVINGCKDPKTSHVMVLELVQNLDLGTNIRQAACVSNSTRNWLSPKELSVYGLNRLGILVSGKFVPVNCNIREPYACAVAVVKNGLCQGSFGDNVVANIVGQFTILGLDGSGNIRCSADPQYGSRTEFKFVNIGYLRKEICDITGICEPAPTEGPEVVTEKPEETTKMPEDTTTEADEVPTKWSEEDATEETIQESTESTGLMPLEITTQFSQKLEEGEVIVAETFSPFPLDSVSSCTTKPMSLRNVGTIRGDRTGPVNININFY